MANLTDTELLEALGEDLEAAPKSAKNPLEERIISGFEDIEHFFEKHGHLPQHGENKDTFERLYAVRLDQIRASEQCLKLLKDLDKNGLLIASSTHGNPTHLDDEALLAELGVLDDDDNDINKLTHIKSRLEIQTAEEIARRQHCNDFDIFKPLFAQVREDLNSGTRRAQRFKQNAQIQEGDYFILGGQIAYVASVGEEFRAADRDDARLRVIYDNGTESNLLMRSLQRALYKDEAGRRVEDPNAGPLFSDVLDDNDFESGTIYVLRSKSENPVIKEHRNVIHKIGVTGGDIYRRIANAKMDSTFLMADVEIVATYKLSNINRVKLENLIHRFFEPAKLSIRIEDRFGLPITPKEWFLVPISVIDEAIEKIKDGTIIDLEYDPQSGKIIKRTKV